MVDLATAPESLFFYWIQERHHIYIKRFERKMPKPWTTDKILQDYRFTNPFRENDKGTIWLREHFREPYRDAPLELMAFNSCWYRMFNWIGTGTLLGWQDEWVPERIIRSLRAAMDDGEQIFTGAHIIRSEFGRSKIDSIVGVCSRLWQMRYDIVSIAAQGELRTVFELLLTVPYIGPFMGYEMVTDLRHTRVLEHATDIFTWANAGPGAIRGLERLGLPARPPAAAVESMRGLLARSRANLPEWVPDLEMRDVEHSCCEFDKYCRVKFGEGAPRGRFNGRE